MTIREPTEAEIEAAARVLCWHNGIDECFDYCKSPSGCTHGTRDFGDVARDALQAAFAVAVDGEEPSR